MNITIITGASSGIGQEFALQLDSLFHNMDEIWLIARRKERLTELSLALHTKCRVIDMDVTNSASMNQLSELLAVSKPQIRMLVNCAGFGLMGAVEKLSLEEQLGMIRLNCEALTEMTYRCLPYMRGGSRIIQMASSAAFLPQANFAVYAASKSYVLSFSRALGQELKKRKIYVTSVCPGPVDTEFFDIAEKYGKTLSVKKLTMVSADKVVKKAIRDSREKKDISVCGLPIQAFHVLTSLLPHSVIFHIMKFCK
ncbi:MAG: SDR family NAD(P)-dependent oxidoreductase [Lachnospiraceae bacterium]|nr:SDR family NAD(P)-dependent oxidoreductase [Lachnospiraceae bacterium]